MFFSNFRNRHRNLTTFWFGICLSLFNGSVEPCRAADQPGEAWALLIGVEKYEKATPLRFTVNDVKQLSATLTTRGGIPAARILEITDRRTEKALQPRKESILKQLPAWLEKPGERDSIIVFFSGHGFRDADGKLYLAPLECDPDDPTSTGIPVEWLRGQLASCKAAFKLLILDACHAGSEKGETSRSVAANELGAQFEDLDRVVTIASSKASEKSQIWDAKEQSLFSYWLNQGLRGHADRDGNGSVDIDELYEFVSRSVKRTAEFRFSLPQTPVRIVRAGIDGVPEVLKLRPQALKSMLSDVAEQLSYAMEEQKFSKVGVLEFINQTPAGEERLGANFGLLGKYCAEELERQLQDRGTGKYSVVERRRLQEALKKSNFQLASLGSTKSLKAVSDQAGGMPVIVIGSLVSRQGRLVRLQCKLQQTENDTDLGVSTSSSAALSESEWAMLGRSAAVQPNDRSQELTLTTVNNPSTPDRQQERVINRLDQSSNGGHVLLDPKFPFKVKLLVGDKERPGVFRGNDCFIPVRRGEVYQIVVENRSNQVAMMRLLVDGLNTLPEKGYSGGSRPNSSSQQTGQGTFTTQNGADKGIVMESWGQHVNLDEARAWVLDPNARELRGGPPVWTIKGFATATGADGKMRQFEIVDADKSLAARQQFTESIGLITVAFYHAASGSRGALGTQAGAEVNVDLTERAGLKIGELLGVAHLRYVDADALNTAGQ